MIDERKLRVYRYLVEIGRMTIDEVPEPYKGAILGG
jgi:hypothetical protein